MNTQLISIFNEVINDKYTKTKHKTYYKPQNVYTNTFYKLLV